MARGFKVLCRCANRTPSAALQKQFAARYGVQMRTRGLVFKTDSDPEAIRLRAAYAAMYGSC